MLKKLVMFFAGLTVLCGAAFAATEINTADQAALDGIAGIGPATSKAMLDERKKGGNFKDWADLEARVKGVGEKNSIKLSAAGLVVNGQSREATAGSTKAAKPAKAQVETVKAGETKPH